MEPWQVKKRIAIKTKQKNETNSQLQNFLFHAGFLIGLIVLKNRKVEHWERKLKACCVIVFLVLVIAAIIWNLIGNTVAQEVQGGNSTFFQDDDMLMQSPDYLKQCHDYI